MAALEPFSEICSPVESSIPLIFLFSSFNAFGGKCHRTTNFVEIGAFVEKKLMEKIEVITEIKKIRLN